MSLTNKTIANSYKDLLQLDNSNNGIGTSTKRVKDGEGTESCLLLSDDSLILIPRNDDNIVALAVLARGTTNTVLAVDTTDEIVKASGNIVNTQYATFSTGSAESVAFVDDTHHAITFSSANYGTALYPPAFGTGTDPATTFTTAEGNGTRASDLVPVLWYVNDAISIDAIKSIEGADAAGGDTTRMHLFSYDFT